MFFGREIQRFGSARKRRTLYFNPEVKSMSTTGQKHFSGVDDFAFEIRQDKRTMGNGCRPFGRAVVYSSAARSPLGKLPLSGSRRLLGGCHRVEAVEKARVQAVE